MDRVPTNFESGTRRSVGPRLVDRLSAAQTLGISVRGLDELLASGKLASLKIGRRRLVDLVDLEQFIAAAKNETAR